MKTLDALVKYVEKAKDLDLVANDARFIAAFFDNLFEKHGSISEELLITKLLHNIQNLEKMAKEESEEDAA